MIVTTANTKKNTDFTPSIVGFFSMESSIKNSSTVKMIMMLKSQ